MFNIIGNSCVSSYIIRDFLKQEFINPFTWCSVDCDNFSFVIDNYYNINWKNYKIDFYENIEFKTKNVQFFIDNSFTIKYPHYILSNCETKINGVNIFSNDIINVSNEKYNKRVDRMLKYNIQPIFLFCGSWEDQKPTEQIIEKYKNRNDVIIMCNDKIFHDNFKFAHWCWNTKLKKIMS